MHIYFHRPIERVRVRTDLSVMDTPFILLMMAACICGRYENGANLPDPFQRELAQAVEEHNHPNEPILPYYTEVHDNIIAGAII